MKKILSLVLALALVLGTIPAFAAAGDEARTGGENLYTYGFIGGKSATEMVLGEEEVLTRAQLAALISELYGLNKEAKAFEGVTGFADDKDIADWAKPFVGFGRSKGWFAGKPGNIYDAKGAVSAQQLAVVLVNALGYEAKWDTVLAQLAELNISLEGAKLTRGQAFDAMWETVSKPVMKDGERLGEKLGKLQPETPVKPATLEVKDVVASNLKTVLVTFNQMVDESTANNKTIKLNKEVKSVSMMDEMTAVVVLKAAVDQSTTLKVTVDGVKTAEGVAVTKFEETITVTDTTIPAVKDVVVLNPKQIRVTFTEPVNVDAAAGYTTLKTIKIDDKAVTAKTTNEPASNAVLVTLNYALKEGTHTVLVTGVQDYAKFVAPNASFDVTVAKDENAPVATKAVVVANDKIKVYFDEPLKAEGTFKVEGTVLGSDKVSISSNIATLTLDTKLGLGATVEVSVHYKGQTDIMGNAVKDWAKITTKVADDTTIPSVDLTVKTGNKMVFVFNKAMNTEAGTVAFDKTVVNVKDAEWNDAQTQMTVSGSAAGLGSTNPKAVKVVVKEMKDASVRKNELPKTELEVQALDSKAPSAITEYAVKPEGEYKYFTIFFDEAMDTETLTVVANYTFNDKALTTVSEFKSLTANADGKSVVVKMKNTVADDEFKLGALKDVAGNLISNANATVSKTTATTFEASAPRSVEKNKVEVIFSQPIDSNNFDVSGLILMEGSNKVSFIDVTIIDGPIPEEDPEKRKAVFTTEENINDKAYKLHIKEAANMKSIYGADVTLAGGSPISVIDGIAPEVVKIEAGDAEGTIKITFSEPVTTAPNDFNSIALEKDGKVKNIRATGTESSGPDSPVVTVALTYNDNEELTDYVIGSTYKVTIPTSVIEDVNNNTLIPYTEGTNITFKDLTAPEVDAKFEANGTNIQSNGEHKVTFTEELDQASKNAVESAVTAALKKVGTGDYSVAWSENNLEFIVTVTGASDTSNRVEVGTIAKPASLKDLAGNAMLDTALQQ